MRIVLTEDDILIFKILSGGPATITAVRSFFIAWVKNLPDYKQGPVTFALRSFNYRLSKLNEAGYLKCYKYSLFNNAGTFLLYALTEFSAEVLCKKEHFKTTDIKMEFPSWRIFAYRTEIPQTVPYNLLWSTGIDTILSDTEMEMGGYLI